MTISSAVNHAIKIVQANLGDVVMSADYMRSASPSYDASVGAVIPSGLAAISVKYAPDKFTYQELQSGQYQKNDVKIIVFNPDGDLNFKVNEKLILDGVTMSIFRAMPSKIGAFIPVWSLVLRS